MKKPRITSLSKGKTRELLKQIGISLDVVLTEKFGTPVYQLTDGTILYVSRNGKGSIWQGRTELAHIADDAEAHPKKHALVGLIAPGRRPPWDLRAEMSLLGIRLDLSQEILDYSSESIAMLEEAVVRRFCRWSCIDTDLFLPVVIYVGEVVRQRCGGEWTARLACDGNTLEPWVILNDEAEYPPFKTVLHVMGDSGRTSLYWSVLADLRDR